MTRRLRGLLVIVICLLTTKACLLPRMGLFGQINQRINVLYVSGLFCKIHIMYFSSEERNK